MLLAWGVVVFFSAAGRYGVLRGGVARWRGRVLGVGERDGQEGHFGFDHGFDYGSFGYDFGDGDGDGDDDDDYAG